VERRLLSPPGINGLSYLVHKEKDIKLICPLKRGGVAFFPREKGTKLFSLLRRRKLIVS